MLTVDSVGRRPLLLAGVSGMTVALLALGASSLTLSGSFSTWASVVALLAYVGAYQVPLRAQEIFQTNIPIMMLDNPLSVSFTSISVLTVLLSLLF